MERYDPKTIEPKWQQVWEAERIFETPNPAPDEPAEEPHWYQLEMLPYPSGTLHMGHVLNYTMGDVATHFRRRKGWKVLRPMGFDSFGLPAENAAISEGGHPREITERNIAAIRVQMKRLGWAIDWTREISAHEVDFYRWTQWLFLKFFERDLAYRAAAPADAGGALPFVLPTAADYPHAPWMVPSDGGSPLTFALAARLLEASSDESWLRRATEWCWAKLETPEELSAYWVKFSLEFLDHVPDQARADEAIRLLQSRLGADGSMPVPGGTDAERLTPLALSPRPGTRSRALFTDDQVEADLDLLERGQQDDGGWTFDWLGWSPGQSVESRGAITLWALARLAAHKRLPAATQRPTPGRPRTHAPRRETR